MRLTIALFLAALLVLVGMEGCTETDSERASKGAERFASKSSESVEGILIETDTTGTAEGLMWDVPAGLRQVVPSSSMRVVQYELSAPEEGVRPAELSLFFFGPGFGGTVTENIRRWSGQFERPDRKDVVEMAIIDSFTTESGLNVTTVRLEGTYQPATMGSERTFVNPKWALHGAVIEGDGGPWFFKAVGPGTVIEHHGAALDGIYRSARPAP